VRSNLSYPPRRASEHVRRQVEHTLADGPTDDLLFSRACLLDRLGRIIPARDAYLALLARDPTHAGALANLGALLLATGFTSAARTAFTQATAAHPNDARAFANLGNLLRLAEQPEAAQAAYEEALRLSPVLPEAHQGLSYLLDGIDEAAATRHRALGFAGRALTSAPYRGERTPIRVLQLVSARGGNIPTSRILDDRACLTQTLVVEFAAAAGVAAGALPPHDLVFNAIGDADRCVEALVAAACLLAATTRRVINHPNRILATGRAENARRLSALPGLIAPRIALLPRAACADGPPAGLTAPFLLRSPGFHTGQHFARVDRAAALPAMLASLPGDQLMAIEYLDATGLDGASRKYRVMFIGGEMLPLHLAVSPDWKVHYFTAGMEAAPPTAPRRRYFSLTCLRFLAPWQCRHWPRSPISSRWTMAASISRSHRRDV
jgi:tetratricopeptide (TPR) repeat protein